MRRGVPAATIKKWRGGNVTIKVAHVNWADFWGANYDLTWITNQIDNAQKLGCNAIRIIGAVNGIVTGAYTRATYQSRVDAVITYCANRGMSYYAVGAGDYATTLAAATQTEIVAHATFLTGYSNIIGYDIIQEIDLWASTNATTVAASLATMTTWYTAVKAVAPNLPVTWSYSVGNTNANAAALDYYDAHQYTDAAHFTVSGFQP